MSGAGSAPGGPREDAPASSPAPTDAAAAPRPRAHWVLLASLIALSALFALWYLLPGKHWIAGLSVFVLPPALLAAGVALRSRLAAYWAGVLALFWFCHGVMLAWSSPDERLYAWIELILALAVIFSANLAGMKARLGRKRG
ncbi:DUF2069 domain-containing protein [Lysobacter enzymogenes]|uniref:Tryptophan repressor binding protein n=1 Tax=Lysobacter enzymogenes TaxID=69 RepID=A0AAU9AMH5_LYSEN|nr:tryptophan repressor binding protein [Lysobacter enzymogenes]